MKSRFFFCSLVLASSAIVSACKGVSPISPADESTSEGPAAQAATQTPAPMASPTSSATATATPAPTATTQFTARLALPTNVGQEDYLAGFRHGLEDDVQVLADVPHYDLAFHVDFGGNVLYGLERIRYTNDTGQGLEQIIFRLYPNYPNMSGQPGRSMQVLDVSVDGTPVEVEYLSERTALAVPLPTALAGGATVTLELRFVLELPSSAGQPNLDLNSAYPLLAPLDDRGGWRTEVGCPPDFVVSDFASYAVNLTLPSSYVVASTGREVAVMEHEDGTSTHSILAGPVRDFAMSLSADYQVWRGEFDGAAIRVFALPDDEMAAERVLGFATDAFKLFDTRYGRYPYSEIDIVVHPDGGGGTEYPGLFYVWYGRIPDDPYGERPTAHEMAHQWWYGVVGNDAQLEPWLDEAFARYSEIIYLEEVRGQAAADAAMIGEVETVRRGSSADVGGTKIGGSVCSFPDISDYVRSVYSKGAVFLDELRTVVGRDAFFAILQDYFQTYRYEVANGAGFLDVANRSTGTNLTPLFDEWVGP